MKTKRQSRIIAFLLVLCLCLTMMPGTAIAQESETPTAAKREVTLADVLAGFADFSDLYDPLDPDTVPDIIGYEEALENKHIKRSYADEGNELNKVVFENLDGTKTMYLFDFPVKYIDNKGKIQDISLEIKDGSSGTFETAGNSVVTTFSAQASSGISLSGNGTEITLIPIMPTVPQGTQTMTAGGSGGSLGSISSDEQVVSHAATRIDEKTIQYRYDSKTTIEYSLTYTGFKEDIVVSEYTGQTEYAFTLRTGGYALEEIDGSYFLVDDAGKIKATIGDIIIFTADERNNTMGQLVPTTIVENEEYLLNIVVDPEFLADENTAYPIRIDPTVEINYDNNGAGAIQDATVYTDDTTNGSLGSIFVGLKQNGGIARILMKFPGLNLSNLGSSAVIESATVTLRDLLCESTSLDVYCYVYAGATWDESNVCWDNTIGVTPNYLSDQLDMKTISYSIGTTLSEQHRYSFNITEAVQGWLDGNYSQEKGIVFKALYTVENGSTYNWKTIGSYNRASYKPTLSVIYDPDNENQLLQDTTYYINNKGTGRYLRYAYSGVSGQFGLLTDLNTSIQWEVRGVADGYVIRAKNDPTKYLAVPISSASTSVEILEVNQSAIPDRCVWELVADTWGYQLQSVYNLKFLYSSGPNLATSYNVPSYGTSNYDSYLWRVADTSRYGTTSSYLNRELNSFSVDSIHLKEGNSKSPVITTQPANTAWAGPTDFTYSNYDTSKLVYDDVSGTFSPASTLNTAYAATVIATHKVTRHTATFLVVAKPGAALIGVTNSGHDHSSAFDTAIGYIDSCGYASTRYTGAFSTSDIDAYLDNDVNKIFVSRSHGEYVMDETDTGKVAYTYIMLNDDFGNPVEYRSNGSINTLDLSNLELAIFVGCYTGYGGEDAQNLPAVAVAQGAKTAIGFDDEIPCILAHQWTMMIFEELDKGWNIEQAINNIKSGFVGTALESPVLCGDRTTKIA